MNPQQYIDAGFRVLRIHPTEKKPLVGGFGKDSPHFTCPAEDFGPNERIALLLGPCEWADSTWVGDRGANYPEIRTNLLICLDLDHGLTVEAIEEHTGPLPDTLTSKTGAHMYYRVAPSAARDQLRQWTNVLKADDPKMGALDLKWLGGYAIEPGNVPGGWDDGGFDPQRIAVLPDKAVRAFVALKTKPPGEPRATDFEVDEGSMPSADARCALASIWPEAGNHFDAALALGGVLATSKLSEAEAITFADDVFCSIDCDRIRQVEVSFQNVREGNDVEVKGWPTLKRLLKDTTPEHRAALKTFTAGIPGLTPTIDPRAEIMNDPDFCAPVIQILPEPSDGLEIPLGDATTVAEDLIRRKLPGAVFTEGKLWSRPTDGFVWTPVSEAQVSRWTQEYSGAQCGMTARGAPKHLMVGGTFISGVWACITAQCDDPTFFFDVPARVVFQNGVLDVSTGRLTTATAEDRIRTHLPFEYRADQLKAHPPRNWIKFVGGQWGSDSDSIALLHQILGYLLSGRTEQEKMFVMVGPPRCGKGTIIKLLQSIMGDACGSFKISMMAEKFSLSGMLGKSVLVDPDVRKSKSAFSDSGVIAERLLSITSGDQQAVRLVGGEITNVVLTGRVLVAANPPFELRDDGGALATRIAVLHFSRSFLGTEDLGLLKRLRTEIPSIVALALEGLQSLDAAGRFVEPAASQEIRREIRLAQNPISEWFEDFCELAQGEQLSVDEAYRKASLWWADQGYSRPMTKRMLGNFMASKSITSERTRKDGAQFRVYPGVRLK